MLGITPDWVTRQRNANQFVVDIYSWLCIALYLICCAYKVSCIPIETVIKECSSTDTVDTEPSFQPNSFECTVELGTPTSVQLAVVEVLFLSCEFISEWALQNANITKIAWVYKVWSLLGIALNADFEVLPPGI